MKKLLTSIGAAGMMVLGATVNAEEINLREWLKINGVTVTNCVTGEDYLADNGPEKLFDGVTNSTDTTTRWLGGEKNVATASVTIEIPESALLSANTKLVLKRIRLWNGAPTICWTMPRRSLFPIRQLHGVGASSSRSRLNTT